jgi:hypothetical protein
MKIKMGNTRVVFLIGNKAIKIGKIRPIRFFFRMISFPFTSERNHQRFYKKYGSFPKAVVKYVFWGFNANNIEHKYYTKHRDDLRVVPTVKLLAWGFILIQVRGLYVSRETFEKDNPFKEKSKYNEVEGYWQFCEIDRKILLADYGDLRTYKFLVRTS